MTIHTEPPTDYQTLSTLALIENRDSLLKLLTDLGFAEFIVHFDGDDDIQISRENNQTAELPDTAVSYLTVANFALQAADKKLCDALADLAFDALGHHHSHAFDEPAHGDLVFDLKAGTCSLDVNQRVVSVQLYKYDVGADD